MNLLVGTWYRFRSELWVKKIFRALGWLLLIPSVVLPIAFVKIIVKMPSYKMMDAIAGIALILAIVFITPVVVAFLIWLTSNLKEGFRRLAFAVYPLIFIISIFIFNPRRWASSYFFDGIFSPKTIVLALIATLVGIIAYLSIIQISKWVADGFKQNEEDPYAEMRDLIVQIRPKNKD